MAQRGFSVIAFILVIFVLSGIIITAAFYIKHKNLTSGKAAPTISSTVESRKNPPSIMPSVNKAQTQTEKESTQIYTNTTMGFSVHYPSGKLAYESKEEVYFWDNDLSGKSFIITNDAFSTADPEVKIMKFNEFRDAKEGLVPIKNQNEILIKSKNLNVDGNPAVELFSDYNQPDSQKGASGGMVIPPSSSIIVYINKNGAFWEVYNDLPDVKRREKSLKDFEDTISTFKFLN